MTRRRHGSITLFVLIGLFVLLLLLALLFFVPNRLSETVKGAISDASIASSVPKQEAQQIEELVDSCGRLAYRRLAEDLIDTAFAAHLDDGSLPEFDGITYILIYDGTRGEELLMGRREVEELIPVAVSEATTACVEEGIAGAAFSSAIEAPSSVAVAVKDDLFQILELSYPATLSLDGKRATVKPVLVREENELLLAQGSLANFVWAVMAQEHGLPSEAEGSLCEQLLIRPEYNLAFLLYEPEHEILFDLQRHDILLSLPVLLGDDEEMVRAAIRPYATRPCEVTA